jgi:hypothetical protein
MKKLPSTMEMIGWLREAIEHDLKEFELVGFDYVFLVWYDSIGMVVPFEWIDSYPDWKEEYEKFMDGQTVCGGGVYHRDVLRFLNIIEAKCSKDRTL